ncbi:MAG: hypothetical protein OES09_10790 [Gammaproteobacteria bacterium]|nr:hypothetical protein [Gammaproteobacteria bacterium]
MSTEPPHYDDLEANPLDTVWRPGEVIVINDSGTDHVTSWLIIPALGRLKRPERWMTWISPPYKPASEFLHANGINPKHLRVIHCRTRRERLIAAEQALASRTNDIVMIWIDAITEHDRERLNNVALKAHTRGMLIGVSAGTERRKNAPRPGGAAGARVLDRDDESEAPQLGLQLD